MNRSTSIPKIGRISHEHRKVLSFVWNIHQGIRNNAEDEILRNYLRILWDNDLKDHLLNEEISISSNIKQTNEITDKFYHFHMLLKGRIAKALDRSIPGLKDNLEHICILLIEMIRHEEGHVKPYMKKNFSVLI